jgi:hypothetical protein
MNIARKIFYWLTVLFLVLLPLQFLFAGYGVFSGDFEPHMMFGGMLLHLMVLLMLIVSAIARVGWRNWGFVLLLNGLFFIQIAMVEIGEGEPWAQALHPFLAFCYWPYVYFLLTRPARNLLDGDAGAAPAL